MRSSRLRNAMCIVLVLILAGFTVVGCDVNAGGGRKTPAVEAAPGGSKSALEKERQTLAAEVAVLEDVTAQFRAQNPGLAMHLDRSRQNVRMLSEAAMRSEINVIDMGSRYASGHPQLQAAARNLKQLQERLEVELQRVSQLESQMNEYDRLTDRLQEQRAQLRHVQTRLLDAQSR